MPERMSGAEHAFVFADDFDTDESKFLEHGHADAVAESALIGVAQRSARPEWGIAGQLIELVSATQPLVGGWVGRRGGVEVGVGRDAGVGAGCTTAAVAAVLQAQAQGAPVAWLQWQDGPLYPPDLQAAGVDLNALVVVHVPQPSVPPATQTSGLNSSFSGWMRSTRSVGSARSARASQGASVLYRMPQAAELLLRAGAFGLVVLDFRQGPWPRNTMMWQRRLLALARQHQSCLLVLRDDAGLSGVSGMDAQGSLAGWRGMPSLSTHRDHQPCSHGTLQLRWQVQKNKLGCESVASQTCAGPAGMAVGLVL